ncbi:PP2C family serine/threonine-protein phosphatase [Okeanomitos corallinicola TIOX110]|uniref:PP2C family serine/threonine-protein phosphatase n=1 Tax=Okeanomitos corallinicola TIOX110 TaxID=3133117 RepID=A0ABZ2UWW8_9CYAN
MSESEKKLRELIKLFGWKLYLEPPSDELKSKWENFIQDQKSQDLVSKICDSLGDLAKQSLLNRFGVNAQKLSTDDQLEISEINKLWTQILDRLTNDTIKEDDIQFWKLIIQNKLKPKVSAAIAEVLKSHLENENQKTELPQSLENTPQIKPTIGPIAPWKPEQEQTVTSTIETPKNDVKVTENKIPEKTIQEVNPSIGIWKYLPIPENEPDKYDEYISKQEKSPEGLNLIGARVRGKMHKHNGTNCDDWFEFTVKDKWTIIAVSDGAGSKKLSRIGAKESCQAAVKYLTDTLENHQIQERMTKEQLSTDLQRNSSWKFPGADIEFVQKTLHEAMQKAYDAVENKAKEGKNFVPYYKVLDNREAEIKDFSATLLLAIHTTIKVGEESYNFVLTCQVGDGMLAAISQEGRLKLLGKADSGDYGGQTEFLTSKSKLEKNNLIQKTFFFPGNLKCLMVMTDGVADDYFPNDPAMLELYGDLVLNQIINISKPDESEIVEQLRITPLGSLSGIRDVKNNFQSIVERIIDPHQHNEPQKISISSVADYAKELNKSVAEVVASPPLLAAGIMDEPMCQQCQNMSTAEKLLIWLDSYYQKGSFDDRTLVVLYQDV